MPVNFAEVVRLLDTASAFDLYRLSVAIGHMLDDPKRMSAIKRTLQIGQEIEYFDARQNGPVKARLLACNKTRVVVQNLSDGKRWTLPYYWLNVEQTETAIDNSRGIGLQRHEIVVGEILGFVANPDQIERYGKVIRLNPKTVTLDCKTEIWKVSYGVLFKVIDTEAGIVEDNDCLIQESLFPL
jgi:hypothetical protein